MKTVKERIKYYSLVLSLLIIFQSCSVYKRVPVSLEEAAQINSKVEVEIINGERIKFKRIRYESEKFYGLKDKHGVMEKTLLDEDFIKQIKVKDKSASTLLTIALPIGIIVVAALIFQDAFKQRKNVPIDFTL